MSFSETIFLFFLALIIFGPKKLPEMARQAGKLLAELRRASNEFKSQIESEISHLELEKRQASMAASPPPGAVASMSMSSSAHAASKSDEPATLAAPAADIPAAVPASTGETLATADSIASSGAASSAEPVGEPPVPASQESHV